MKRFNLFLSLFLILNSSVSVADAPQATPLSDLVVYPQYSAPATVIAKHNSQLSSEVSGVVEAVLVEVGSSVKQGDPLLRLDSFNAQQQYRQVVAAIDGIKARITFAEFQLQQSQRLERTNNISEERLQQRQMELVVQKAELLTKQAQRDQVQRQIDNSTIKAPFSGVVIERQAELGAFVDVGMPVLRLLAEQGQQVEANLHRNDAAQLQKMRELVFVLGDQKYALQRVALLPMLHPQQRTQRARFSFTNAAALVGASGRLQWRDHRPSLPAKYLQRRGGALGIFVMQQGEAVFVVLPNAQEGRAVRIEQLPLTSRLLQDNTLPHQRVEH